MALHICFRRMFSNVRFLRFSLRKAACCSAVVLTPLAAMSSTESTAQHFAWIGRYTPAFPVSGHQVEVLQQPDEFYSRLKAEIGRAKRRIVLASLYLGTSKLEQELVDCLHEACERSTSNNGRLGIQLLVDYNRGRRGSPSSCSLLQPLVQQFPGCVEVALFHSPDLRGFLRRWLPERFNETVGLSHLKVYLCDNTLIMSGANLSESYFTNRQDRYVVLRDCPDISNFFSRLVTIVASLSFRLLKDGSVQLADGTMPHPFEDDDDGSRYREEARRRLLPALTPFTTNTTPNGPEGHTTDPSADTPANLQADTWVFPLVQMAPFGIDVDDRVTRHLFQVAPSESHIMLASGYFNMTDEHIRGIVGETRSQYDILTASPQANGFYGGQGFAGAIPNVYTYVARQFLQQVCSGCQQERIKLAEFSRPDWTFHAKGLWYYRPGEDRPCLTFIGSPNFGYRSIHRDLEAQIAIATDNKDLRDKLHKEQRALYSLSETVTLTTLQHPQRHIPLWVILLTKLIRTYF